MAAKLEVHGKETSRLLVFERKILREIYGPLRNIITGELRKLHNTEVDQLFNRPNIVGGMRSARLEWPSQVVGLKGEC